MKRFIIALLLLAPVMSMAAGIGFINKAILDDGVTVITTGTLEGLNTGPTGGSYEVFITNGKSFKGDTFSVMNCTVHKQLATPMAAKFKNKVTLATTYYEANGTLNTAIGTLAGLPAMPIDGYIVNVNNKAKNDTWNLLKCTIKG